MYDVVILTDSRYENPKNKNWYINQVLEEDQLLINEIKKTGLSVCKKDWNSKEFNWSNSRIAIFRSTWDYFDRFDEFFLWKEKIKNKLYFVNSSKLIDWNIDKIYLKDLKLKGINIPKSIFIKKNKLTTVKELFEKTNFKIAVLKPNISGAARHTYKIKKIEASSYEDIFKKLIITENMIFQEFIHDIEKHGEISLVLIAGKYTHAVRKKARKGDFRVQDDHGGTVEKYNALKEEVLFAEHCITLCPEKPVYARVDIIYDNKGRICLNELELIEPELWFRNFPKAAMLLAQEIKRLDTIY